MALAAASLFFSSSSTFLFSHKLSPSLKLHISLSTHSPFSPHPPLLHLSSPFSNRILPFQLFSAVQEISVEENPSEGTQQEIPDEQIRKVYVVNLPWDLSASDIENLFSQCGTVKDVEVIKLKNGKSRGFAFVTMDSREEALAAIDKYNLFELQGRIIRVEFAKSMKKPSPPPPPPPPPLESTVKETQHKLYVSNLAWKVRSSHLREFFAASCNPVSTRVILDSPSGRAAGYGFVSFSTKEEAEAAISTLDGKELMGRPICLKVSQRKVNESASEPEEAENSQG